MYLDLSPLGIFSFSLLVLNHSTRHCYALVEFASLPSPVSDDLVVRLLLTSQAQASGTSGCGGYTPCQNSNRVLDGEDAQVAELQARCRKFRLPVNGLVFNCTAIQARAWSHLITARTVSINSSNPTGFSSAMVATFFYSLNDWLLRANCKRAKRPSTAFSLALVALWRLRLPFLRLFLLPAVAGQRAFPES